MTVTDWPTAVDRSLWSVASETFQSRSGVFVPLNERLNWPPSALRTVIVCCSFCGLSPDVSTPSCCTFIPARPPVKWIVNGPPAEPVTSVLPEPTPVRSSIAVLTHALSQVA